MKLKCTKHKRRVMVVNEAYFTHRSDGSLCDSETASQDIDDSPHRIVLPNDPHFRDVRKENK